LHHKMHAQFPHTHPGAGESGNRMENKALQIPGPFCLSGEIPPKLVQHFWLIDKAKSKLQTEDTSVGMGRGKGELAGTEKTGPIVFAEVVSVTGWICFVYGA